MKNIENTTKLKKIDKINKKTLLCLTTFFNHWNYITHTIIALNKKILKQNCVLELPCSKTCLFL